MTVSISNRRIDHMIKRFCDNNHRQEQKVTSSRLFHCSNTGSGSGSGLTSDRFLWLSEETDSLNGLSALRSHSLLLRTALERLRPLCSALGLLLVRKFFMFSCSSSWPGSASAAMETGEGLSC